MFLDKLLNTKKYNINKRQTIIFELKYVFVYTVWTIFNEARFSMCCICRGETVYHLVI